MREDNFDEILVSRNVRYLLWKKVIPKVNWVVWLTNHLSWNDSKARRFLEGQLTDDRIPPDVLSRLSIQLGLSEDGSELRFEDLASVQGDLLRANLRYLFDGLEHGKKKALASQLGVSPTTISRWLSGIFEPRESMLKQLVLYFGLPHDTDLKTIAIFLSLEPITQVEKKAWLLKQLKTMEHSEINMMFPALRKILV